MNLRKYVGSNFFKYFVSYLLILIVSLTGIFFIVNFQLKKEFESTFAEQDQFKLNNFRDSMSKQFLSLNKINLDISTKLRLAFYSYSNAQYSQYEAQLQLQYYMNSNSLIQDIIYIDLGSDTILCSTLLLNSQDGNLIINQGNNQLFFFPYQEILNSNTTRLIKIQNKTNSMLLYIPTQFSSNFDTFFVINQSELKSYLNMGLSSSVIDVCLLDTDNNLIAATSELAFNPYLNKLKKQTYISQGTIVLKKTPAYFASMQLVVMSDTHIMSNLLNSVFRNAYLTVIIITLLGVILTFLFMRITYLPLHNLIKKIAPTDLSKSGGDLQSISRAFDDVKTDNENLINKIHNYRLAMQKSIISSIASENKETPEEVLQIEDFFGSQTNNRFFVGCFFIKPHTLQNEFKNAVQNCLADRTVCLLLENQNNRLAFLLSHPASAELNEQVLFILFDSLIKQFDCQIALSDSSNNPLDIARLYGNAMLTSKFVTSQKIVCYESSKARISAENNLLYPYKIFDELTNNLDGLDFDEVIKGIDELFDTIEVTNNPDFFIRCVLIDTLTMIINSINKAKIRFEKYSELYYETLYLCRSSDLKQTEPQILNHVKRLLQIYESEIDNSSVQISQIKQYILENYLSSNFSVTVLADYFNISIKYMSFLFKKKTNMNIIDYVWQLRLEKAKELLQKADMPIGEISIKIGYDNASSFRRKFKESTGLSPSQFRIARNK